MSNQHQQESVRAPQVGDEVLVRGKVTQFIEPEHSGVEVCLLGIGNQLVRFWCNAADLAAQPSKDYAPTPLTDLQQRVIGYALAWRKAPTDANHRNLWEASDALLANRVKSSEDYAPTPDYPGVVNGFNAGIEAAAQIVERCPAAQNPFHASNGVREAIAAIRALAPKDNAAPAAQDEHHD